MKKNSASKINNRNLVLVIGFLFFFAYFFLAIWYYKERTLFADTANFLFQMINLNSFFIAAERWSEIIIQLFPLAVIKSDGSLPNILLAYSFSSAFFHFLVFLLITFVLRNYKASILLLITLTLTVRHTFYAANSEFSHGLSCCILFFALMEKVLEKNVRSQPRDIFAALFTIIVCVFFHPLLAAPLMYVLVHVSIAQKAYFSKSSMLIFIGIVLVFGLKFLSIEDNSYENTQIPTLNTIVMGLLNFTDLQSFIYFKEFVFNEFGFVLLVVIISISAGIYQKHYVLTVLFILAGLLYTLAILLAYHYGESPYLYQQRFVLYGFIIAIYMGGLLKSAQQEKVFNYLSLAIIFISLFQIYNYHEIPSKRISYVDKLMGQEKSLNHNDKFILKRKDFLWDVAWLTWSLPCESILISSLKGKNETKTICVDISKEQNLSLQAQGGKFYITSSKLMNFSDLNKNYFNLKEETPYRVIVVNGKN